MNRDSMRKHRSQISIQAGILYTEQPSFLKQGMVFFDLRDTDGNVLYQERKKNLITLDAGILAARLFRDSLSPNPAQNNGITMLAVGTGATGAILSPDAPQNTQRKLNTELTRKAFASVQYRDSLGVAVSYPTSIVDFTTTFSGSEANGALNEMGLMSTYSLNPLVTNPINNGPSGYDPTIDVTGKDIMMNYLTFGVITKPVGSTLTITWRISF